MVRRTEKERPRGRGRRGGEDVRENLRGRVLHAPHLLILLSITTWAIRSNRATSMFSPTCSPRQIPRMGKLLRRMLRQQQRHKRRHESFRVHLPPSPSRINVLTFSTQRRQWHKARKEMDEGCGEAGEEETWRFWLASGCVGNRQHGDCHSRRWARHGNGLLINRHCGAASNMPLKTEMRVALWPVWHATFQLLGVAHSQCKAGSTRLVGRNVSSAVDREELIVACIACVLIKRGQVRGCRASRASCQFPL